MTDGLLAIWNDIVPGHEDDFRRWHTTEHMPERMSVPGFRRGRRLFSPEAVPRWLTLYDLDNPHVLRSPDYLARLNAPSEWTKRVLPTFVATERMGCRIISRIGQSRGGTVATIRSAPVAEAELTRQLGEIFGASGAIAGSAAVISATPKITEERALRRGDRDPADAVLLLELLGMPERPLQLAKGLPSSTRVDLYALEIEVTR